ncbi:hypothetical protein ABPK482_gp01 [Acinetobacter phage vB_AbaP_APK14]|uniref:Uncharacterized protein n=1 Tax=Acinetobacter phage vB_AbaP_APK14 TaxID=2483772 RepID=A0A499SEP3_9CAUD|nr:hypothetical protein ABPK482_gp01 [Acinetobacter phage vB_AbaP_APK14]
MAYINADITKAISDEITCITQENINKAIDNGWSLRSFLFKVFYVVQDHRGESFFGDGIGTKGTFILDVKDEHIFTMMKTILKLKGFSYERIS